MSADHEVVLQDLLHELGVEGLDLFFLRCASVTRRDLVVIEMNIKRIPDAIVKEARRLIFARLLSDARGLECVMKEAYATVPVRFARPDRIDGLMMGADESHAPHAVKGS